MKTIFLHKKKWNLTYQIERTLMKAQKRIENIEAVEIDERRMVNGEQVLSDEKKRKLKTNSGNNQNPFKKKFDILKCDSRLPGSNQPHHFLQLQMRYNNKIR